MSYSAEFFFFQAEDGIRDYKVTGVQTCALPIFGGHDPSKVHAAYNAAVSTQGQPTVILARTIKGYGIGEAGEGKNITHQQKKRSEERRVGKEGRSRWAAYH